MSAEIEHPLTKIDSAVSDTPHSPGAEKKISHRRTSSTVSGVFKIEDLGNAKLTGIHSADPVTDHVSRT